MFFFSEGFTFRDFLADAFVGVGSVLASSRRGNVGRLSLALPDSARLLGVFLPLVSAYEGTDQPDIPHKSTPTCLVRVH
jgi:hypothetical protein